MGTDGALNAEEIKKMMDTTIGLQQQAQSALKDAASRRVPVFDPRTTDAIEKDDNSAIIWTTKSIELAYQAIKEGFSLRKSPFYRGNINLRKPKLNFQYTEEELKEVIRCKKDIIYFANKYCYLKTEKGRRQIKLRPYQEKLLKHYQDNRFNITMQSRQTGKTTTTAIFATWFTCFHVDKTFAIIANKDKIAAEVFGKVKAIIEDLPFFLKPGCYGFGPQNFSFDNGCRAVYSTATIDSIQGFSVDCLYIDEFAYIKNSKAREFWINVYPTISSMDTSKVIITSTPNGKNLFFELWQGAVTGKNGLKPFRVDWWQAPGHDEKWAAQERAMIGEEGFAQQYGLSFDAHMKSLLQSSTFHYLQKIEQNFVAGLLSIGSDFDECFRWSTQFRYSLKKDWFLLSIDIGEGLGKDSSVIKIKKMIRLFNGVYDGSGLPQTHYKLVTVGVFESNTIQIPDFAKVFVALCRRLNLEQTRIVVERNTYGDLFMLHVDNICEDSLDGFEIPLESYAKFKRNEDAKFEKGLRVNPSNKKFGVAAYQEYMNSKFNIETDSLSIEQIREFGEDERGNYKASVGHDDLVMPEVNLSYYIKTNNIGWREFLNEFADKALIDAYNYNLILKIDTNAVRDMKRDIAADNELEDISTEYDLESLNPNEENSNDNEYLLIGKTKEDRTALIKRGGGDDEYSLINEAAKKIPKPQRERSQHEQYFSNEYRPRGNNKPKISAQDLLNLA